MLEIRFEKDQVVVTEQGKDGSPYVQVKRPYAETRVFAQEGDACTMTEVPVPKETVLAGLSCRAMVLHAARTNPGGKE